MGKSTTNGGFYGKINNKRRFLWENQQQMEVFLWEHQQQFLWIFPASYDIQKRCFIAIYRKILAVRRKVGKPDGNPICIFFT